MPKIFTIWLITEKKFASFYTNLEVIYEHGLKKSDGRKTYVKNKSLIFRGNHNFVMVPVNSF